MRDVIACEVFVLVMAAYIGILVGLELLIGGWMFAIFVPTFVPAIFGAFWVADRFVPRAPSA